MTMQLVESGPVPTPIPARFAAGVTPQLFAETRQGERRLLRSSGSATVGG